MATLPLPSRSDFLLALDQRFRARRLDLLSRREEHRSVTPTPLADTACIRETEWQAVCRSAEAAAPSVVPRPWSTTVVVDGTDVSAAIYDLGTALYDLSLHELAEGGATGPVGVHLIDVGDHREARVWNDLFDSCQHVLGLGRGRVHARVRIADERSCVEIDEIIYELREHIVAVVNDATTASADDDGSSREVVSATCTRRGVQVNESGAAAVTTAAA